MADYVFREHIFRVLGNAVDVYMADKDVTLYCNQKRLRVREAFELYDGKSKDRLLMQIDTDNIWDFSSEYTVRGTKRNVIGTFKRKGFKSALCDEWILKTAQGEEGLLIEDSAWKAFIRRFVPLMNILLPQAYHMTIGAREVAYFKQHFNPFIFRISATLTQPSLKGPEKGMVIAAGILLTAIEQRQSGIGFGNNNNGDRC